MRYIYECLKCGEIVELDRKVADRDNPVDVTSEDCEHEWGRKILATKYTRSDWWAASPGCKGKP